MNIDLIKKSFFTLTIVLLNFLIIEVIWFYIIKKIEPRYSNKFNLELNSERVKKDLIGEAYSKKIPYLRDKNQYEGSTYISLKNDREFIFNELKEFSSENQLNILVQGDSLGKSLNMKNINDKYLKLFKDKKLELWTLLFLVMQ